MSQAGDFYIRPPTFTAVAREGKQLIGEAATHFEPSSRRKVVCTLFNFSSRVRTCSKSCLKLSHCCLVCERPSFTVIEIESICSK